MFMTYVIILALGLVSVLAGVAAYFSVGWVIRFFMDLWQRRKQRVATAELPANQDQRR